MFFISIRERENVLGTKDRCVICGEEIQVYYKPMEKWGMEGTMCGRCYSKKIGEYYPGEHVRINKDLD